MIADWLRNFGSKMHVHAAGGYTIEVLRWTLGKWFWNCCYISKCFYSSTHPKQWGLVMLTRQLPEHGMMERWCRCTAHPIFCSRLSSSEVRFYTKNSRFAFL